MISSKPVWCAPYMYFVCLRVLGDVRRWKGILLRSHHYPRWAPHWELCWRSDVLEGPCCHGWANWVLKFQKLQYFHGLGSRELDASRAWYFSRAEFLIYNIQDIQVTYLIYPSNFQGDMKHTFANPRESGGNSVRTCSFLVIGRWWLSRSFIYQSYIDTHGSDILGD